MHSASDDARAARLADTAARLRLDAALADISEELKRRQILALVLKGPSIARWLYGADEARPYNDLDLLVAPDDFDAAADVLESQGYERAFDDRGMPTWWREHGIALVRKSDGVTFDLHRRLSGVRAEPDAA